MAEAKQVFNENLQIYCVLDKELDNSARIGSNLFFANKGDPYTYDVAKVVENCKQNLQEAYVKYFEENAMEAVELKSKTDILNFAELIKNSIKNEKMSTK